MRTSQEIVKDMLKNSEVVKQKRISEKELEKFIEEYHDSVFSVLLNNGYVRLSEDMRIVLVKLKDRHYVLRGNSYVNQRKYKLKLKTSREMYDKIEEAYSLLLE